MYPCSGLASYFYGLPQGYCGPKFHLAIASGVGVPIT